MCVCVWGGGNQTVISHAARGRLHLSLAPFRLAAHSLLSPPPPACTCTAAPRATASSGGTELHTSDEGNACCTSACPPKPSLKQAARHLMQTGATHPARAMRSAPD